MDCTVSPEKRLTDIRSVLSRVFGFGGFRPGQEDVVSRLLAGSSVLAVFPTGAGKSLCYQLPALLLDGLTLVVSPLIALMREQVDTLVAKGIPAARLDSSLSREETAQVMENFRGSRLKLLYVSPERLTSERFLNHLRQIPIAVLAVDEAHCISEWGHNFRPDYLKIAGLARDLNVGRVLALTATATPAVARDIAEAFGILPEDVVRTGVYRPNLDLHATPCLPEERDVLLLDRLRSRPPGPTIVYVTLQRTAERVAAWLTGQGIPAEAYHAGMETRERERVQDRFMASDRGVVAATIAFGMGVDKADIRYVYHYNLPKALENFVYGDTPTPGIIEPLIRDLLGRGRTFHLSLYDLSAQYDIRPTVLKTLLAYLEIEDVLQATGSFFTHLQFKPLKPSREILARFDSKRAGFLKAIFTHAVKARTWFSLDLGKVSREIGAPREHITIALEYLEEKGDLDLRISGFREGYRLTAPAADPEELRDLLADRFLRREEKDLERLDRVVSFAVHPGCLTQGLAAYFGETMGICGHCGPCRGLPALSLPAPQYPEPGPREVDAIRGLQAEAHPSLGTPRQLARFLCGITSPATTRGRLGRHPLFGSLAGTPFRSVLALATRLSGESP